METPKQEPSDILQAQNEVKSKHEQMKKSVLSRSILNDCVILFFTQLMMLIFRQRPFCETLVFGIILGIVYVGTLIVNKVSSFESTEFYVIYITTKATFNFYIAGWMISDRGLLVMYQINVIIIKYFFYQKQGAWKLEDNLYLFLVFAFPTTMQLMTYAKNTLDGIILVVYTILYAYNFRDAIKQPFKGSLHSQVIQLDSRMVIESSLAPLTRAE